MAIVMCFEPVNAECAILPYCVLRKALEKARTAFVEALDDYSLADLVKPRASLQAMLSIEPAQAARLASAKGRRRPTSDAR
jgi:Rrf2 family nitric oxide-sensitive transcriptional repressor